MLGQAGIHQRVYPHEKKIHLNEVILGVDRLDLHLAIDKR